jgi:predicted ArsR family transcriptional regulator
MRAQLGEAGVESLIQAREQKMEQDYRDQIRAQPSISKKLNALAEIRSREGYMAEVLESDDGWQLIEHHCPICAAASQCQAFCRSELQLFRALLPEATVERSEHLLTQGARCIYKITPI